MDRTETQRLTFIKALVAWAWLDKAVKAETLNILKHYLKRVNVSDEEALALKPLMQRPIREREGSELVDDWLRLLYSMPPNELRLLYRAVCDLIEIDTTETDDAFLHRLGALLQPTASVADYVHRVHWLLDQGGIAIPGESEGRRGDEADEFVRSRIMHTVRSKMLDLRLTTTELSAREVAFITSYSALLGRIAHADEEFTAEEKAEISHLLREVTTLDPQDIEVIMATIADDTLRGVDLKSLTRTFFNLSTPEQREQLLNCLFMVAGADGNISPSEVDEIERIAVGLNMSHRDILRSRAVAMETVRKRLSLA